TTTLTAGVLNITDNFLPLTRNSATATTGWVNIGLTVVIILCTLIVIVEAFRRWFTVMSKGGEIPAHAHRADEDTPASTTRIFRCC
ncbi:MAG: hypothetical protein QHI48_10675, partial [Bacteroidota bacterium]|nr:hypothetical protein [Bacteroidota bacterium]